ncbi:MAG: SO_0444 family Cu/Zn efflux transporter [Thermoguttaceae bacterium]|jgi:uncharacterized membrane protein YraQ (UPF0718 family)/copper chaperone CopZ
MSDIVVRIALESWGVLGEMAPYLLFGFLMAGVLSICISPEFIERHLGGRGFGPVVKAALFGVPLPLCSCGVIPVAASFRRHGASRAAATSFLLSTPQTGVDSIAITYALLGTAFAVYRPIIALATGLLGGLLVMLFTRANGRNGTVEEPSPECHESCCSPEGSKRNVVWRALEYGFVTLPRDIGLALLVGVVIAGAITAFLPVDALKPYLPGGVLSILLMMALGIPIYVCASASVPIAAGLIHAGASPGAVLAFLIAGPASNAATITTVWKLLGRRTVLLYLLTIAISAVGAGLLLDWLLPTLQLKVPDLSEKCHEAMKGGWVSASWAILLLAVLAYSYAATFLQKKGTEQVVAGHSHEAESSPQRLELAIDGMTCSHCVAAITRTLKECDGVASVHVDLATGRVVVLGEHLHFERLAAAIAQVGYAGRVVS